jgi:hypothetical protein
MDFVPYEPETFSRKKREYMAKFSNIASEASDVPEFFGILLKSHDLFLNLVQVNVNIIQDYYIIGFAIMGYIDFLNIAGQTQQFGRFGKR